MAECSKDKLTVPRMQLALYLDWLAVVPASAGGAGVKVMDVEPGILLIVRWPSRASASC